MSEIKRIAKQTKEENHPQVYLNVAEDGKITGHWFFGRSDFVLHPGFIILFLLRDQTEEAIAYAITMIIRNQEGYTPFQD